LNFSQRLKATKYSRAISRFNQERAVQSSRIFSLSRMLMKGFTTSVHWIPSWYGGIQTKTSRPFPVKHVLIHEPRQSSRYRHQARDRVISARIPAQVRYMSWKSPNRLRGTPRFLVSGYRQWGAKWPHC